MTRRARAFLSATAAVTLLGLAGPALAIEPATQSLGGSKGVRYKVVKAALAADDFGDPTVAKGAAYCDDGWTAVSGGQSGAPYGHRGITDSGPGTDKSYWHTAAWQRYDIETRLKMYAVCMQTTELTTATLTKSSLPAGQPAHETVYCNGTGSAVGGGVVKVGTPSDFSINSSFPVDSPADVDTLPDDGWRTYVDYTGSGGDGATFNVSCLEGNQLVYGSATAVVPPHSSVSAKAVCPEGSPTVGGGVFVSGTADRAHLTASRPWDGSDVKSVPDDGWRGAVNNTSDSQVSMTVHAVCRTAQIF